VLDAASLLVDHRARRAKTDRLDAAGLLRTLMALELGEAQVCRVVHVPSREQEDIRRRSRERARLVVERGQHSSRIKGLLMTQGIRDFEPTRHDWQTRFEALRTADGRPLAPCLRAELMRECRRLRQVMEMIAEVEAEQKEVVAAENGNAAQLSRLRGIGPEAGAGRANAERNAPAGTAGVTVMTMTERKVIKAKAVAAGQAAGQRDPGMPK
jgi:transposase